MRDNRYNQQPRQSEGQFNQRRRDNFRPKKRGKSLSFRLGQIFSFGYNLAVIYLVYTLIQQGEKDLALKIFFGNLMLIAFALILTFFSNKAFAERSSRRGGKHRERRFNKPRDHDRENFDRNNDRR